MSTEETLKQLEGCSLVKRVNKGNYATSYMTSDGTTITYDEDDLMLDMLDEIMMVEKECAIMEIKLARNKHRYLDFNGKKVPLAKF